MRIQSGSTQSSTSIYGSSEGSTAKAETTTNNTSKSADTFEKASPSSLDYRVLANPGVVTSHIDTGRLAQLKERIDGLGASEAKQNQLARLIGEGAVSQSGKGSHMDRFRNSSGGRDRARELVGLPGGGLSGLRNQQVSNEEETQKAPSKWEIVKTAAREALLQFAGSRSPIPMPPTPPDAETGKNMHRGVSFLKNIVGTTSYEDYINKRGGIEPDKTPNPDSHDNRREYLTPESLRGIRAVLGGVSDPSPQAEEVSGGGGPVNPGLTTAGAISMAAEFVNDLPASTRVISSLQLKAIEARLGGKIKILA